MLKAQTNGSKLELEAQGSVVDMVVDVAFICGSIYEQFKKNDPAEAEIFRTGIQAALETESPAWNDTQSEGTAMLIQINKKSGDAPTGQS